MSVIAGISCSFKFPDWPFDTRDSPGPRTCTTSSFSFWTTKYDPPLRTVKLDIRGRPSTLFTDTVHEGFTEYVCTLGASVARSICCPSTVSISPFICDSPRTKPANSKTIVMSFE